MKGMLRSRGRQGENERPRHPSDSDLQVQTKAGIAGGANSALNTYRALRQQYYGSDAYDLSEAFAWRLPLALAGGLELINTETAG
jgi:hypothetical protein